MEESMTRIRMMATHLDLLPKCLHRRRLAFLGQRRALLAICHSPSIWTYRILSRRSHHLISKALVPTKESPSSSICRKERNRNSSAFNRTRWKRRRSRFRLNSRSNDLGVNSSLEVPVVSVVPYLMCSTRDRATGAAVIFRVSQEQQEFQLAVQEQGRGREWADLFQLASEVKETKMVDWTT